MNIFEELAESYTYNGVVSLKALDDDIGALEGQIDSYNATLRELQLRGKKPGPLIEKMRDAKVRLSLLKALYKRESDKNTSDDIIMNMLGISANNASEVESPETAADGKEPVAQDFEESEVEADDEGACDSESISEEEISDDEIAVEEVVEPHESRVIDLGKENTNKEFQTVEASEEEPVNVPSSVSTEIVVEKEDGKIFFLGHEINIKHEDGSVIIERNSTPSHTDYFLPSKEEEVENITYPSEPMDNVVEAVPVSKAIELLKGDADDQDIDNVEKEEYDEHEYPPPPTIDDYLEPVDIRTGEPTYSDEEDSVDTACAEVEDASDNRDFAVIRDAVTNQDDVVVENKIDSDDFYFPVYNAFEREIEDEIYSSFDLSPYTNMVNTNTVTGVFDNDRKILEVTFFNARDYSVFVELLKKKKPRLLSFLEKPKSIFMDVYERHGDEEIIYHYEFAGCRLKKLLDTKYASKDEHGVLNTVSHECTAVFKYKKLKLT